MADLPPEARPQPGRFSIGVNFGAQVDRNTLQPNGRREDVGNLKAWDPVTRKVVWETPEGPRATSGALATAGNLVFMGNGPGKMIDAYDAKTGAKLWSFDAKTAVLAAPISYELDGKQYVAASVGGTAQGGYFAPTYARMLVFALDGKGTLPEPAPYTPPPLNPPPSTASAAVIQHGAELYATNCSVCHGLNGMQARTSFPDLTVSPLLHIQQGFDYVVLQGARADRGMGSFAKELKGDDAVAVREYLVAQANLRKEGKIAPPGARPAAAAGAGAGAPTRPRETGHAEN